MNSSPHVTAHPSLFESLEPRRLLSSYTVDSLVDESDGDFSAGDFSLREAIELANANGGADDIDFDAALAGGTIVLGGTELEITDDLTITGLGASLLAVSGNNTSRAFINLATTTISGLLVTGGFSLNGGGIYNTGTLTLTDSTVSGNSASPTGGGIFNFNTLVLENSSVSNNTAAFGGGITNVGALTLTDSTVSGNIATSWGGGINNTGTLALEDSTVSSNTSPSHGGGIYNVGGTVTLLGSTVSGNAASQHGGAIYTVDGTLTLTDSMVTENTAHWGGGIFSNGTLTLNDSTVSANTTTHGGGGIINSGGALTLNDSTVSNNTAAFNGGGIYSSFGAITILSNSTVSGNSAGWDGGGIYNTGTLTLINSTVSGNTSDGNGGGISNFEGTLTVTNSTVVDNTTNDGDGGGIASNGTLTLTNSTVARNAADVSHGGGIHAYSGTLVVTDSLISDNTAGRGAGIYGYELTLTLTNSTLSGNTASKVGGALWNLFGTVTLSFSTVTGNSSVQQGGGIYSNRSTLTLTNSAVTANTANGAEASDGGGIYSQYGPLTLTNSTVSGNTATRFGGGMLLLDSPSTIINSTIAFNHCDPPTSGGGIFLWTGADLTLTSTIVANNTAGPANNPDDIKSFSGTISASSSNNLIGDAATSGGLADGTNGNIVGADPLLDALADNGGPTQTHALLAGSPAIDTGSNQGGLTTDQRGLFFSRAFDSAPDIGAYERQTLSLIVSTATDESDGDLSSGEFSLREAIELANINPVADEIAFDAALSGGTIMLAGTELTITDDVTITGFAATPVAVQSDGGSRVLHNAATTSLIGLTLRGGVSNSGGGIYNSGTLTLTDSAVSGNSVTNRGGGVYNLGGTLTLFNSSVWGNTANDRGGGLFSDEGTLSLIESVVVGNTANLSGGGIYNEDGPLTVIHSLVGGNTAVQWGGGIYNDNGPLTIIKSMVSENSTTTWGGGGIYNVYGALILSGSTVTENSGPSGGGVYSELAILTLTNSTISENTASAYGAGIYLHNPSAPSTISNSTIAFNHSDLAESGGGIWLKTGANLTLTSTIVANNTAGADTPDDMTIESGLISGSSSNNLIGDAATSGGLTDGTNGNIVGADPLLDIIDDNGGPTSTRALLAGSPAIDAGSNPDGLGTDQRGVLFSRSYDGAPDIGAYERQSLSLAVDTVLDESDGDFSAGDLSLREAIEHSNANPLTDEIGFDEALAGGTIVLGGTELSITDDVTITGFAATPITVQSDGGSRVFSNSATTSLSGLVVTGGVSIDGGGILNTGVLTLNDLTVSGNSGINRGGGIFSTGDALTLNNSIISANTSDAEGAGVYSEDGTLTLNSSTVSGNTGGEGAGIYHENGSLALTDSTVSGNYSNYYGGGIYSLFGVVTLVNSTVSDNTSEDEGGGIYGYQAAITLTGSAVSGNTVVGYGGGGIYSSQGSLTLANTTVSENAGDGNGGGIYSNRATVIINNSMISGNTASIGGVGGGIYADGGTLTFYDTTVSGNTSNSRGGGIYCVNGALILADSFVLDNNAGDEGGGIYSREGTLTLTNSTVSGNSGAEGGGISNYLGTITITGSTVSENSSYYYGGGVYTNGGLVTITNSTVSNNSAVESGGGIYTYFGPLTITNSTVSGNTAVDGGGGIYSSNGAFSLINSTVSGNTSEQEGGGVVIASQNSPATITNSTIAINHAAIAGSGGGIWIRSGATLTLTSTIVTANTAGTDTPDDLYIDGGTISGSSSNNLIGDSATSGGLTDGVNGNIVGVDAMLGALADNGGPTLTHALLTGSPAIGAGSNPDGLATDQRGTARARGDSTDIGSFEANVRPTLDSLTASRTTINRAQTLTLTADGATDSDGTITEVRFYIDANGDGVAQDSELLGTDTDGSDGFSFDYVIPGNAVVGNIAFLAVATDNDGEASNTADASVTVENIAPNLGGLSASHTTIKRGQTLTITADGVDDPDGTITEVRFYLDANGDGVAQDSELLGTDTDGSDGYSLDYVIPGNAAQTGTVFLVVAVDNDGETSNTADTGVTVVENIAPTLGSLAGSATEFAQGDALTLTAVGATDTDGSISEVRFYLDANGDGTAQDSELLGTDTDGSDGFSLTLDSAQTAALALGTNSFLAVAIDDGGDSSATRTRSTSVLFSLHASDGSIATGSSTADDTLWTGVVNRAGDVILFESATGTAVHLGLEAGAPKATGDVTVFTDAKDGFIYAAYPSAEGLILARRAADGTWDYRNLTGEAGIQTDRGPMRALTQFTSTSATRRVLVIAGINGDGDIVAFQQSAPSTETLWGWSFVDISADLSSQGMTTPVFTELISYVTPWNAWTLAGIDGNGNIQSVWVAPASFTTWRIDNLSNITGAPPISGQLTVTQTSWSAINLGGVDTNGHLVVTWWVPSFGGDWVTSNLTNAAAGETLSAGRATGFVTPWGAINYAGINAAGDVTVYWWTPQTGGWVVTPLTGNLTGDRPEGSLTSHVSAAGTMNVLGTTDEGEVTRLWWAPNDDGKWKLTDLTGEAVRA